MLLVEKQKVTSTELAQTFEVSVRTIYRDIDILAQAGIPLYTTTGKYGGVHLMEGFVVDRAMFSEREKEEIIISLQSIKGLPGVDIERVRNKISSIFNHQITANREWLEIDFASTTTDGDDLFATIKYAIQNKKALRTCYMNANGIDSERVIEPIQLAFRYMSWYLFAYCKMRKKYRWFRITRIINIELLNRSFNQEHDEVKIPEILNATGEGKLTHVELVFSRDVAHFVYDAFEKSLFIGKKTPSGCLWIRNLTNGFLLPYHVLVPM